MSNHDLKRVIEALIFAADAPLTPERIRETLETCTDEELARTVEALNGEYEAAGHSFMIRQVAGGYQVTTRPEFGNWIKKLYLGRQKGRLSQAALESLAIIAFKQPISRVDIAQIRGVNSDGVIGTLLERKLVTISGRSEAVGRPLLYSTTPEFLEFFGINDLAELPKPREIEELIGKEGMPEDVLQALSSDKQLKLPISFEPETAGDGSVTSGNLPLIAPVATEAASEQASESAVESVAPFEEAVSLEEETLADNSASSIEMNETEAPRVAELPAENIASNAEQITIVSQEEVAPFLAQTELPEEAPLVVAEAEAASPAEVELDTFAVAEEELEPAMEERAEVASLKEEKAFFVDEEKAHELGIETAPEQSEADPPETTSSHFENVEPVAAISVSEASLENVTIVSANEIAPCEELEAQAAAMGSHEPMPFESQTVDELLNESIEPTPHDLAAENLPAEEKPVAELIARNESEAAIEFDAWPEITEANGEENGFFV